MIHSKLPKKNDFIDSGYLNNDAYKVHQATAWIPLLDTTATNGCMQVTFILQHLYIKLNVTK